MVPKKNEKVWMAIGLFFSVFLIYLVARNLKDIEILIQQFGIAAPLVTIMLYGLFALTPISTDPLTIISGALFGPLFGILISWMGNNLAALVEYFFGTKVAKITNFKKTRQHLPFGLSKLPVASSWFLIFGRLIPGYGGKLISFMAGMYHVPLMLYLWTTAFTNLLGSLLLSLGGFQIIHLLRP